MAAVRLPVRIVVLVVVVPVRMAWDVFVLCARTLHRAVLRPLGRLLVVIPLTWLWRHVLTPLGRGLAWLVEYLLVVPLVWLWRWVLEPVGLGVARFLTALVRYGLVVPARWVWRWLLTPLGRGVAWLVGYLVVVPARWVWRWVLAPVGRGVARLLRALVVLPLGALWRWVLVPLGRGLAVLGRETAAVFAVAWRIAGYVSRAVGRALRWAAWQAVGRPARWFYCGVCTPVGHFVRDAVWRPVRDAARAALASARDTVRRVLFGAGPVPRPVGRGAVPARTLGSTTNAPGAAPAPEVSPHRRG